MKKNIIIVFLFFCIPGYGAQQYQKRDGEKTFVHDDARFRYQNNEVICIDAHSLRRYCQDNTSSIHGICSRQRIDQQPFKSIKREENEGKMLKYVSYKSDLSLHDLYKIYLVFNRYVGKTHKKRYHQFVYPAKYGDKNTSLFVETRNGKYRIYGDFLVQPEFFYVRKLQR